MSGWDTAEKRAKESQSIFVKLENDGDTVVVAFLGEPHVREVWWNESAGVFEDFTDAHAKAGKTPSAKFKLNVFNKETQKAQILEVNAGTMTTIGGCRAKYGLEKFWFEVKRNGKKGDTKTVYSVLPDKEINAEELKTLKDVKLHDLAKTNDVGAAGGKADMGSHDKKKGESNSANGTTSAAAPAPAPAASEVISAEKSAELVGRLKIKPQEKIKEFLGKFSIAQVKALKASDLATAEAMLDEWEGKTAAPPAADATVDPFA